MSEVTLAHRVEAFGYDVVTGVLRLLPFAAVSAMGGAVLRAVGPLTSKQKIAETNLRIAFPNASDAEMKRLLRAQWDNIGRTFAEFPLTDRLDASGNSPRVRVDGLHHFTDAAPAIIVTGHFANWEVMAAVLTQSGLPVRITYRRINNPLIDARVRRQREAYGTKFLVQKSTHRGGRELLEALRDGESVALLNDQKFNTGLSLPFFGQDAMTAQGAVRLSLKTGRPLVPMSVTRDGANFTVRIDAPLTWETVGARDADVETGVRAVNAWLEARIRETPAQWFWVHRRWPRNHYRKGS